VGTDKRERRRLERARKKGRKARHATQLLQHSARRERAEEIALEADRLLRAGDFASAASRAARAAEEAPRDRQIALLWVRAVEELRDMEARIGAYEHLRRLINPDPVLLILLAHCYVAARQMDGAVAVVAEARRVLPARMKERRLWLTRLEDLERRLGVRQPAQPHTTSLFAEASEGARPAVPQPPVALTNRPRTTVRRTAPTPGEEPPTPAERELAESNLGKTNPPARPQHPSERQHSPMAFLEIPIALAEVGGLDALACENWDSPADVRLAGLAARVRDAESFDVLLSIERARGLLRLSHQEETARKVLSVFLGRALLADEVGLGKTVEAGIVLSEYLLRGRADRTLVLTPPSLVAQWRAEMASKFDIECRTSEGDALRTAPKEFWQDPGVIVASLATARTPRQRELVTAVKWDLVIIDEAHALKNADTLSYALVSSLTSRFLLLLTATPVENDIQELYNLVSLIRPGVLGGRADFMRRFGKRNANENEAVRREIRTLLAEVMVRNTRALSGVHLPPRFARTVLVAPHEDEGELYRRLVDVLRVVGTGGRGRLLFSTLLQEAGSSPQAVHNTLEKVVRDTASPTTIEAALAPVMDFAASVRNTGKGQALMRVLQGREGPVIVFTRFRATLDFLQKHLATRGVACERLDGGVPPSSRNEAIDRWRSRGGVLVSTDVGSEGLNLQFCHQLVNFDLPWNPMRIEQRIGRLHRIGQENPVDVVNLCLAGSIEEHILRILDERINLFELVVGEVEMILGYLEQDAEFPDLIFNAYAVADEESRERQLGRIADALSAARERYSRVKAYDENFFRNELGV